MSEPVTTRLRLTFTGRVALAFVGASLLPAILLGGTLSLIPALGAALILAAAIGAWLNLRGLRVDTPPPRRAFTGERFDVPVHVSNLAYFPARDLLFVHGEHDRDQSLAAGYLPSLSGRTEETLVCRYRLLDRGHHRRYRLGIRSSFPFGMFESHRTFDLEVDFLALPRLGVLHGIEQRLPFERGVTTELLRARPGSEEFWGLRQWREGESQNLIHWKTSARHGRPIVRELRGEDRPRIHLVLDPRVRVHVAGRRNRSFEEAVSLVATLAQYLLSQQFRLRFTMLAEGGPTFDFGRGRYALFGFLNLLAEVEPLPRRRHGVVSLPARDRGEALVIVYSGGGRGESNGAFETGPNVVALDVDDREIEAHFQHQRDAEAGLAS